MNIRFNKWFPVRERRRTYIFTDGELTIHNVRKVFVRSTGTHYLEDAMHQKHIVSTKWVAIRIDGDWVNP